MLLTGENTRVFQLHLNERGGLSAALAKQAIRSAAELGYNTISFSGGEPLLVNDLVGIACEARKLGMRVNLITDGTLLDDRRAQELAGLVDSIAIGLDGVPERHNALRGAPDAFEKMQGNLAGLRASHISFGFVFTLTAGNLFEMEWAAEFALREGARLLQVHPRDEVAERGCLLASRLRQIYQGRLAIDVDLANTTMPPVTPVAAFALAGKCVAGEMSLGRFLSPIVVESDGLVVPLRYGFPRHYALGSLLRSDLRDLAARWVQTKANMLAGLYNEVLSQASQSSRPLINLYEWLSSAAAAEPIGLTA